jgi:Flp pilus assembly protein TadB
MDALLEKRYPRLFHERIEVHRLGPFGIRRPIVRACFFFVLALAAAGIALVVRVPQLVPVLAALALAALLPVWGKWRFAPARLPVVLLVPFVLVAAYLKGWWRARGMA